MRRHLATSIAVVVALVMWAASAAQATTRDGISCGAVITQSVTLTRNLLCTGLAFSVVGGSPAAPITVDLAGHTVKSAAVPAVDVSGSAVTVEGGRIVGDVWDRFSGATVYTHLTFDGGRLEPVDTGAIITDNRFLNGANIYSDQAGLDIEGNRFFGAPGVGFAMWLTLTWATVIDNTVRGYGTGIEVAYPPSSADIERNRVSHSGIGITTIGPMPGVVTGNQVAYGTGDGILLAGGGSGIGSAPGFPKPGMTVSNNSAFGNGGDGIDVDPTGHFADLGVLVTITANTAIGNVNYGIESPGTVPPNISVTDGGGNVARFNGAAGQCVNVVCAVR